MTYDPNRVLDLRFFGLNAAGDFPDRSGYGFDQTPVTFAGDDSELEDGNYGQKLVITPNKYIFYALVAGDALDFGFGFTYEAWVYRTGNFGALQGFMGKTTGGLAIDVGAVFRFEAADTIGLGVGDGAVAVVVTSVSTITDINLHHLVATNDLTTTRIYIDGAEDNSGAAVIPSIKACAGSNFAIGRYANVGINSTADFEVCRVYNRVLGAAEILSNYQYGPNRT